MPKTMATMSTTNEASRIFCVDRYRNPSITARSPALVVSPPSGGIAGSRTTAHSVASSAIVSSRYIAASPPAPG